MNIPKTIRIGSFDYDIKLTDERLILDNRECKGIIDYEFHSIKINNSIQDKQGQEQTFLHELIHGIIKERSLNLGNADEETTVEEIALGIHQVIRDNASIFIKSE